MARAASARGISTKPKPRGCPVSRSVDQGDGIDRAVLCEQRADGVFVGGKGQIAHVNLAHTINTLTLQNEGRASLDAR